MKYCRNLIMLEATVSSSELGLLRLCCVRLASQGHGWEGRMLGLL